MQYHRTLLLSMVLIVSCTVVSRGTEPQSDELAKLEGVWVAEQVLSSGTKVPQDKFPFELHFEENRLTFKFVGAAEGKDRVHEISVDASTEPFKMDITRSIRDKKMTVHAIYKFDGARLVICSLRGADGQPANERPISFDSSSTVRSELLTLNRKPASGS
jgi:uncharacterized protein (TIGR03067 family)